ncbi:PREDICTED: LOW QUALITY PROTEIN: connector enhancer of kinase suppressor of ras 1 [Chaetura pelagica]|uniref:LOW QUALITY PROTEIN: connector enhancer of kinase suppressor of ras 1 n=1 Tax=Chaetura pelagica TaxID=8897 RepID=UPI000523258C|nr:PREDICTED: LOW QUALITY PROTEIN: connector enhancer of kinase suppressor of ras 1 [Chaetura pelagica]
MKMDAASSSSVCPFILLSWILVSPSCSCQHIGGICESILGCSPPTLLDCRAVLERVRLELPPGPRGSPPTTPHTPRLPHGLWESPPTSPDTPTMPASPWGNTSRSPDTPPLPPEPPGSPFLLPTTPLGLEITSTSSCLHFVSAATSEALAAHGGRILPGDEIVQVNEQVVVGWTRVNLAKKLLEKASGVTLVLKKVPLDLPGWPPSPVQQLPGAFLDTVDPPDTRSCECPGSPVSLTSSAAADLDSGPDSTLDPVTDGEDERDLRLPGRGQPPDGTQTKSPRTGRRPKGVATRLSRRRVSGRDLGRVDCDGWLLRKKDHVGFMAQKWKRCWFVLKGHTLYWYHHPNDEKAVGLINVATYDLESTREQKKKYVFQLSHQRYKPFVFAAETLADLSMWVSHLVTAKTKYTLANQSVPDREEDCYSETEAEDPDDESPRHRCDSPKRRFPNTPEKAQPFPASSEPSSVASSPQGSPRPCSPMGLLWHKIVADNNAGSKVGDQPVLGDAWGD